MIEQKLEQRMVERFSELLSNYKIQVYGTLQPSIFTKGEDEGTIGTLIVKMNPREYETTMVPTCQINGAVALSLMADVDYNGKTYLDICDIIMNELEKFQKCLDDVHELYTISDEFVPTGFQLTTGETSIDTTNTLWNYSHNFIIYGIVQDKA